MSALDSSEQDPDAFLLSIERLVDQQTQLGERVSDNRKLSMVLSYGDARTTMPC